LSRIRLNRKASSKSKMSTSNKTSTTSGSKLVKGSASKTRKDNAKADPESNTEPEKDYLRILFFGTIGFGTLYVFNCLVSIVNFWTVKYGPRGLVDALAAKNFGGIIGYLISRPISGLFSKDKQLFIYPAITFLGSTTIFVVGELMEGQPELKMLIGLVSAFVVGAASSLIQCCITEYVFKFGTTEIAFLNGGRAFSGVVTTLIAMANIAIIPEDNVFAQALAYQIFQLVALIFIGIITLRYYKKYPNDAYLFGTPKSRLKSSSKSGISKPAESSLSQNSLSDTSRQMSEPLLIPSNLEQNGPEVPQPSLWSTFKIVYPYFFNMFLVFVITMNLVPAISFAMGTGWNSLQSDQLIYLVFNLADLVGKMIFSYYIIESPLLNNLISLSRFGFVVIACYSIGPAQIQDLQNNMLVNLSFTFMVGFTGGYLNSSVFHVASSETKNEHQSNSAFLMIFAILGGLSYGAFVNTFGLTVTQ
jgi:Nucleoside transporter